MTEQEIKTRINEINCRLCVVKENYKITRHFFHAIEYMGLILQKDELQMTLYHRTKNF